MTDMPKYYGLCETCEHDATCTLRRDPQLNIIECEEFSIQPVHTSKTPVWNLTPYEDPVETAGMGLCANCQYMNTCGFTTARQKVLQCEEYTLDTTNSVPLVLGERSKSAA
jgi:hypothetical protein